MMVRLLIQRGSVFRPLRRLVLSCVVVMLIPARCAAQPSFAARLSSAAAAMEYWDVTAWFESGHRFTARFLITNQGPGTRTAAAAGHIRLPNGDVVPIAYGRTSEAWSLSDSGRRLKIASAVLDVSTPTFHAQVDSDRRGIKLDLAFDGGGPIVSINPLAKTYAIDVLMPVRVQGSLLLSGMPAPVPLDGRIALTHTAMEVSEADLVMRRVELFGRTGGRDLYLIDVTPASGDARATLVQRQGAELQRFDALDVELSEPSAATADPGYAVARRWEASDAHVRVLAQLPREFLRWDPLEIVPQPFRFVLSLNAAPRRVWSDAEIEVTDLASRTAPVTGTGIGVVTFARKMEGR